MNRRSFITKSALSSFILPSIVIQACKSEPSKKQDETKSTDESFILDEITIDDLQKKMADGSYTARSITELYLERIKKIDKSGFNLNSVIEINPDALAIADQLDNERKDGRMRGPMHGIPVLIKDNINTGDKMMTTAGSLALEGNVASTDAFLVKKLRESGAVLLGKTNLSEWANFRSTRSSSGWSSRGGQTKNPYALERNPCGSSSGSGTAVAANLCAVAIGTETNGSIACPSSINGIVGIKPTVGLVSRTGVIPISHTQDTAGPMCRTVKDAVILLGAIQGIDEEDKKGFTPVKDLPPDYTKFLNEKGLNGKRIGVEKSFLKVHEGVDQILQRALEQLRQAGAEVVEVDLLSKIKNDAEEYELLQFEFRDGLNKYLSTAKGKVKSLEELIVFNKQNEEKVMPFFKQEILESSQAKGDLKSKEYKALLEKVLATRKVIDDTLKENNLDALCGPTNGPAWCTDVINGDHFNGYGMYSPAAMAGYPSISVPMGMVHDLPVGLCFFASAFEEPVLIEIAYAYEQVSKNRMKPSFKSGI